ncbi:MAG TPA: hypothetical protein VFW83_08940 [Bryobacteraceae bacterium]|nr:hypothetical protein [Bryobacteraceae bacterium]
MRPPSILQIYREILKPGARDAFAKIEEQAARICADLNCPHPYLGIESLTGPEEVWFLNGYESQQEIEQVREGYAKNAPLMAALTQNAQRRTGLILKTVDLFATYRADLSDGSRWSPGQGRFLAITVMKGSLDAGGAVFEAPDGTRFVFTPAPTRDEAEAKAAHPETHIFAVRPLWSMPSKEWADADPKFWEAASRRAAE